MVLRINSRLAFVDGRIIKANEDSGGDGIFGDEAFTDYNDTDQKIRGKDPDLRKGPSIYEPDDTTGGSTTMDELNFENRERR